jgi:regulator of nucleoside diphosphate kinase
VKKIKNQLLLAKNEYETIVSNIKSGLFNRWFSRRDAEELEAELKKATLVNSEDLPEDVVRLNSTVTVRDDKRKVMEFTVVMPDKADIKQRKISILSPIGTALIGYRKGKKVFWRVPAGERTFRILDVKMRTYSP